MRVHKVQKYIKQNLYTIILIVFILCMITNPSNKLFKHLIKYKNTLLGKMISVVVIVYVSSKNIMYGILLGILFMFSLFIYNKKNVEHQDSGDGHTVSSFLINLKNTLANAFEKGGGDRAVFDSAWDAAFSSKAVADLLETHPTVENEMPSLAEMKGFSLSKKNALVDMIDGFYDTSKMCDKNSMASFSQLWEEECWGAK